MNSNEIKIGQVYYFNNREVLILSRECGTDFFRCATKFKLPLDCDGRNFCGHCLIGGGDNIPVMDCDAEVYQVALNSIIEEIENDKMNHEIIFVPAVYLQQKPFEYKENKKLLEKNHSLNQEINDKQFTLRELNNNVEIIKNQLIDLSKIKDSKCLEIDNLNFEIANISEQIKELNNQVQLKQPIKIEDTEKVISTEDLLSLIKDSVTLEMLYKGGVDNWDWYGESLGEDGDIEKEALKRLTNLGNK